MKLCVNGKRVLALLLACILTFCLSQAARAAACSGSITLHYAISGAEFQLYLVGEANDSGEIVLSDAFAGYCVDLDQDTAASTLRDYVLRDDLTPLASGTTDEDGNVTFSHLNWGIYLVLGQPATADGVQYYPAPILISHPQVEGEGTVWEVTISAKYSQETVPETPDETETPQTTELSVLKVWKNDDAASRPSEITVQLLASGVVYDTVILNDENNWAYQWSGLDAAESWSVVEKEVPEGYQVSSSCTDTTYVITNAGTTTTPETPPAETTPVTTTPSGSTPSDSTPSQPSSGLPRTGQLWWPVSLLACTGMVLVLVGLCRRRGSAQ